MITVDAQINGSIEKVWDYWTNPKHIVGWCFASNDWHAPYADNDLKIGGKFKTTMQAKDGSMGFDFEGVYSEVVSLSKIAYEMADGRKVIIIFEKIENGVKVIESFDPEAVNSLELQKSGWQAILNNFKWYVEAN
jgi:uncharacterized protein YndB with AHSA1/START domain